MFYNAAMTKKIAWQSVKIDYPQTLYTYALWYENDRLFPLFMTIADEDLMEIKELAVLSLTYLNKKPHQGRYLNTIVAVKLKFVKDYPLKKSLWQKPEYALNSFDKNMQMVHMLGQPEFYHVCVAAFIDKESGEPETDYRTAFAFYKSEENLDPLMVSSDCPVSGEIKNAGIYSVEDIFGYDLVNDEIVKNEETVTKSDT